MEMAERAAAARALVRGRGGGGHRRQTQQEWVDPRLLAVRQPLLCVSAQREESLSEGLKPWRVHVELAPLLCCISLPLLEALDALATFVPASRGGIEQLVEAVGAEAATDAAKASAAASEGWRAELVAALQAAQPTHEADHPLREAGPAPTSEHGSFRLSAPSLLLSMPCSNAHAECLQLKLRLSELHVAGGSMAHLGQRSLLSSHSFSVDTFEIGFARTATTAAAAAPCAAVLSTAAAVSAVSAAASWASNIAV